MTKIFKTAQGPFHNESILFIKHFVVVILDVQDWVYEEYAFIFLSFVSLFNLLINLNDMNLQFYKFFIQVADGVYGRI